MDNRVQGKAADAPFEKEYLRTRKLVSNLHRGEKLAKLTILFELLLLIADVIAAVLKADARFHYEGYLLLYTALIVVNLVFWGIARNAQKAVALSPRRIRRLEAVILTYLALTMAWGAAVSLMDQKLFGQPMVFMVMMMIPSVLFFTTDIETLVPFGLSTLFIAVGLPLTQPSQDVLIGDYVNLTLFIITAWVASRLTYQNFIQNLQTTRLLETSKTQLEQEIEENQKINRQLVAANQQLKNMALLDELTNVPNRRGFRNFVDIAFEKVGDTNPNLAILLADVDNFKRYNDQCGHDVGDKVLVDISGVIGSIPHNDDTFFCRWGGDEFVMICFNATEAGARLLAETIRAGVKALQIPRELYVVDDYLSISVGIGLTRAGGKRDVSRVISLADSALSAAKKNGRNRVESITDLGPANQAQSPEEPMATE